MLHVRNIFIRYEAKIAIRSELSIQHLGESRRKPVLIFPSPNIPKAKHGNGTPQFQWRGTYWRRF